MWQNQRTNRFKQRFAVLVIGVILLSGCAAMVSECPPLAQYSGAFNQQLVVEVEGLAANSPIVRALADYMTLRDMVRACRRS